MAEDIVGGLFGVNPAMYQQQQQQQVFNRAVAMQNLNPFQQAAVGVQQAGYNLAGALGGALGGVDPQLQRISALNAISKQIDQTSPESMMSGAKMLADAGFMQEALGLAQYARKANSELALAKQRMNEGRAAAIPKEVQIAEYVSTVKTQLGQLQAMEQTPDVVNAINLLQSRLDALPQPKEAAQNADIVKAQRAAEIVRQLAILKGLPEGQQSPDAIRSLETELAVLSPAKAEKENADVVKAQRIGELVGQIDVLKSLPEAQQNPALIRQLDAQLASLSGGSNKVSNFAQQLIDRGFKPGSTEFNARMDDYIKKETALPEKPIEKANIKEIGVSAKGEAVYLDVNNDEQFIFKLVGGKTVREPYAGKVDTTKSSTKIENILPGAEKLADVPKFRADVQRTIDSQLKVIDATDTALVNIDDSIKTNNFASYRAAQVQFAKAIAGAGDLSTKELLAAGADPSLLGGTADYLSRLFSSTPTLDTQNNIRKTLLAIRKVAVDKAQNEITQQRKIAEQSNYPKAALDTALNFPQLKPYQGGAKASKTLTTKSGKTVTVTEE